MKLLIAIVHDEDAVKVMDALNESGFSVTKLCSTGGFLRAGNTTLLMGVEDDQVDAVIAEIEKVSKTRKQYLQTPTPVSAGGGIFIPNTVEVVIGGATIFVTNVERFEKV